MRNTYELLTSDLLTRWSEGVRSLSEGADQLQRETTEWWISVMQGVCNPAMCMDKAKDFNNRLARTLNETMADWLRWVAMHEECLGQQFRTELDLLGSESVPDAQTKINALSELGQEALRINMQAQARSCARLTDLWVDFWRPSKVESEPDMPSHH